jgi:hypothetical protein
VLFGIGLMVAEAHIGAFGVIGVGGIVAFVIGAIMMFPSGAPGFNLSLPAIVAPNRRPVSAGPGDAAAVPATSRSGRRTG